VTLDDDFKFVLFGYFLGDLVIAYSVERFIVPWLDNRHIGKKKFRLNSKKVADLNFK
jgi:hypothetical protein